MQTLTRVRFHGNDHTVRETIETWHTRSASINRCWALPVAYKALRASVAMLRLSRISARVVWFSANHSYPYSLISLLSWRRTYALVWLPTCFNLLSTIASQLASHSCSFYSGPSLKALMTRVSLWVKIMRQTQLTKDQAKHESRHGLVCDGLARKVPQPVSDVGAVVTTPADERTDSLRSVNKIAS
ncbi:unnamed protein product [Schistocephalus solidus]|uniref:Reverse transcriptase n=1 Tax=Schistocephalus solidus TaxID=70667 RepID=A0A183STW3_SCHSO|nr:unnamed protein product [Schistocephalus solidus]